MPVSSAAINASGKITATRRGENQDRRNAGAFQHPSQRDAGQRAPENRARQVARFEQPIEEETRAANSRCVSARCRYRARCSWPGPRRRAKQPMLSIPPNARNNMPPNHAPNDAMPMFGTLTNAKALASTKSEMKIADRQNPRRNQQFDVAEKTAKFPSETSPGGGGFSGRQAACSGSSLPLLPALFPRPLSSTASSRITFRYKATSSASDMGKSGRLRRCLRHSPRGKTAGGIAGLRSSIAGPLRAELAGRILLPHPNPGRDCCRPRENPSGTSGSKAAFPPERRRQGCPFCTADM